MRALAILALAGACGGAKAAGPTPIANQAMVVKTEGWTVARVLAAMSPDVAFMMKLDTHRVRTSPILAPYWDQITAWSTARAGGTHCDGMSDLDATVVMTLGGTVATPEVGVWLLDTDAQVIRRCVEHIQAAPAAGVRVSVDGDFASIQPAAVGTAAAGMVFLDDHTVFLRSTKAPGLDRAATLAATRERADAPRFGELDDLFAADAPLWALVVGSSPAFVSAGQKFRTAALTLGLGKRVDLDMQVRMLAPDAALSAAQTIEQQGQTAVTMGFVTELTATADADLLAVHVALTKDAIDKLVVMFGSAMSGAFGATSPVAPVTPPPVAPAPIAVP